jgi:hypothetical protein
MVLYVVSTPAGELFQQFTGILFASRFAFLPRSSYRTRWLAKVYS